MNSREDVLKLIKIASKHRTVGMTQCNAQSSRSHMIMTIYVTGISNSTGIQYKGKLHLIDLAGSERLKKSGATGKTMKETQNINKSLSALADVMHALAANTSEQNNCNKKSKKNQQSQQQQQQQHIPFRNSTLTKLLQDSLGGNSKSLMFVNIAPSELNVMETLSSLQFAAKVKTIQLGQAKQNKS